MKLIVDGNNERYVRELAIDMLGDISPKDLVMVLSETGFDCMRWKIEKLHITHWHGYILRKPIYDSESLSRLNLYLLHTLPNLSTIKYHSADDRRYYEEFPLDGLVSSTLCQLQNIRIISGLHPEISPTAFVRNLTSLTLGCPILTNSTHLPMVFAETLEILHMGFSSADTIWDRFYTTNNSGGIRFNRLKTLVLEYMPNNTVGKQGIYARTKSLYDDCYNAISDKGSIYNDSSHLCSEIETINESDEDDNATLLDPNSPTNLLFCKQLEKNEKTYPAFPVLQNLSICKYSDSIARILRYFSFENIPFICIRDITNGWSNLRASSIAGLSGLRIQIKSQSLRKCDEHQYQTWINQIFSVSSQMRILQLDAQTSKPITLPDVIGLKNLSSLSFSFRVDLGTIPSLLSQLPYLQILAMHVHPWSSLQLRNQGIIGCDQLLTQMPSLSNSLKTMVAYVGLEPNDDYDRGIVNESTTECDENPTIIDYEIAWLLARVPSLLRFKTDQWTSQSVSRRIKELLDSKNHISHHLTHLRDLKMEVWKY
ncbi:hypothetical protein COEREDRAFT_82654 [Coemansia reversa NRRL 1564]|uniref:RNI-like protein n=1 Tax=Coemansia reversa (strain ATCC 12441 / NRRL 1564) TaxID=763665 RepID=A0A2G5B6M2_COERN|nr:hypothetical protein COEREDRAFT_82654 [Coemansia reversa NRRL 1564]|eukprot:PIA14632.1 hypothetical protein COEREDRAFT_82654 [Coemansia reversa NRRL 1564]